MATIELPWGAQILRIDTSYKVGHLVTIWALINTEQKQKAIRRFRIAGTGHEVENKILGFFPSIQDGPFIWHIFEIE